VDAVASYLGKRPYLQSVAGFSQQHTTVSLHSGTTAVRAPETVIRGRWSGTTPGFIGEELLLNHRRSGRDMGMQLGVARYYAHDAVLSAAHADLREQSDNAIKLPPHKRLKVGLTAATSERRSGRGFSGKAVTLEETATILWHAQGISGRLPVGTAQDEGAAVPLRNAPSGGGLYPIRLFILAKNVRGLPEASYEYQPHSHTLLRVSSDESPLSYEQVVWTADIDTDKIGFSLAYTYDLYVNSMKYGDSGLVFALIEVGGISQNVHLARTALGMIGCDQGGYNKQALERLLNCDGTSRHVVHFTFLGHGEVGMS